MKYAFVLGRVYSLSIAELVAILERPDPALNLTGQPLKILESSPEILLIETEAPLNAEKMQRKLGGVVKILEVVDTIKKRENDSINFALKHYFKPGVLKKQFFKDYKGKVQFGVSIYILDMSLLQRPPANSRPQNGKDNFGQFERTNNIFSEPKRIGMMI